MPLTAAIHQAVAAQLGQLEDHGTEIIGAHVVLLHANAAAPGDRYQVRVHLALPGPDIYAEHVADDLYMAIEQVAAKLARQLRKRKTALTDKRRRTAQRGMEQQRTAGGTPRSLQKATRGKVVGTTGRSVPQLPRT
jgi:putative sigma-54 modulation protein